MADSENFWGMVKDHGRGKRGGNRGGGATGRGRGKGVRKTRVTPVDPQDLYRRFAYVKPSVYLKNKADYENFIHSDQVALSAQFVAGFGITDNHIISLVDKCKDLKVLDLGDSDSGDGSHVTKVAVQHIANTCSSLQKIRFESCTKITDDVILALMKSNPQLVMLEVSGNDKISGAITNKLVKAVMDKDLVPQLKFLNVVDQRAVTYPAVQKLRKARPDLNVVAGESDSDSFAHGMVLDAMGMDYGDGYF